MPYTIDNARTILNSYEETSKALLERKSYDLLMDHYTRCLDSCLFIACKSHSNHLEGIQFLKSETTLDILHKLIELPKKGRDSPYFDKKNINLYNLTNIIHLLGLINDIKMYKALSEAYCIESELKSDKKRTFWKYYTQVLFSFCDCQPIEFIFPNKLKGLEKYWFKYATLMALISSGSTSGINEALMDIRNSFTKHNTDKRMLNAGMIDPSGYHNFAWDFRLHSISHMSKNLYNFDLKAE